MHALTEAEFHQKAENSLRQIFVNDNSLEQPFSSHITERRIIYPYKYEIKPPLTDALITAASKVGDSGFYWSILWRNKNPDKQTDEINHCYIPWSEFISIYVKKEHKIFHKIQYFFILENVIYSPNGKWAIMFSHENYALVGGSFEFVKTFERLAPNIDQQVYSLIDYFLTLKTRYPDITTIDWLPSLLTHVYGQQEGERILQEFQNTPPGYYQEEF